MSREKRKKEKEEEATASQESAKKKKKKRKRKELYELPICTCTYVFFSIKQLHFLPSVLSPFWGGNFLVGLGSTIYFPSSLPNQTHLKKVFILIFSPKFSIHPISPSYKHTLKELIVDNYYND